MSETIFALSSGSPPAAISVIRVSGPNAHHAGNLLARDLPAARQAAVRELRCPQSGDLLDQALVLRFDGPASATGEDSVELHCHGGRAVVDAVLRALSTIQALRPAQPGEFTRRAFENGRIGLTEAEGLADLIEAETESQRRAALMMAEGGLSRQIDEWQARLLDIAARAESAIDYVDEDGVDTDPSISRDCAALAEDIRLWLERPRAEPLREGVRVVIAGPPNAGKSSLLNALVGSDRAIVTDVPGTTRDHIDVHVALSGVPMRLTDTAGLRDTAELVERIGVDRARHLMELADIIVWLGDKGAAPEHPRVVRIQAKADLHRSSSTGDQIAVSSKTGAGIEALVEAMVGEAREVLPAEGHLALNRRQFECLADSETALLEAAQSRDVVIAAEGLRSARSAFDRLTGRSGVEDMLDALFGRFCLGK